MTKEGFRERVMQISISGSIINCPMQNQCDALFDEIRNAVLEEAHDRLALELAEDKYGLRLRQRINILDVTFQRSLKTKPIGE